MSKQRIYIQFKNFSKLQDSKLKYNKYLNNSFLNVLISFKVEILLNYILGICYLYFLFHRNSLFRIFEFFEEKLYIPSYIASIVNIFMFLKTLLHDSLQLMLLKIRTLFFCSTKNGFKSPYPQNFIAIISFASIISYIIFRYCFGCT